MSSIIGVPSGRVSNIFVQQKMLSEVQQDQTELYKTQMQIASGKRFQSPSADPLSAARVCDLQRQIEMKTQFQASIEANNTFLSMTDSTLMSVFDLVTEARGTGLTGVDVTCSDAQRQGLAQQVQQTIGEMMNLSNYQVGGRYLFAGSQTNVCPYEETENGYIEFCGNNETLQSYCDQGLVFDTNVSGGEIFGGFSSKTEGTTDVDPNLTFDTKLADLHAGDGVEPGSIEIGNGKNYRIVDLSSCETIGDVTQTIKENAPEGSRIELEIRPDGLAMRLIPTAAYAMNFSINEVAGGTTAADLGILAEKGVGSAWLEGTDLDPQLTKTTQIEETFGSKAQVYYHSESNDAGLIFRAKNNGAGSNWIQVVIEDTAPAAGMETASYSDETRTLTLSIKANETTASLALEAVNGLAGCPIEAVLDPITERNGGKGAISVTPPGDPLITMRGTGTELNQTSGLQIFNDGQTYEIDFEKAGTYEDMLNTLNASKAKVFAEINDDHTGINIHSCVSGCDFAVGENGGNTAEALGIRTFAGTTELAGMNYGTGVQIAEDAEDFTFTIADGTEIVVDLAHKLDAHGQPVAEEDGGGPAQTIQDVLDIINRTPENWFLDSADLPVLDGYGRPVPKVLAQLNDVGNGIELVDRSFGDEDMTITRGERSHAAWDLGLVPEGDPKVVASVTAAPAIGIASPTSTITVPSNNGLFFRANESGVLGNATIRYEVLANPAAVPRLDFDLAQAELTFYIQPEGDPTNPAAPAGTTANDVLTLLENDPEASRYFYAYNLGTSTGDGAIHQFGETWTEYGTKMIGSAGNVSAGLDTNPLETEGIFSSLIRLREGLVEGDLVKTQHATEMLSDSQMELEYAQADLGARGQGLDLIGNRLKEEQIQLASSLSLEIDVDFAEATTKMTAQMTAYQASLQTMAAIFSQSILDYL